MAIEFMMDQHVPGAISRALTARGVNVLAAFEDKAHLLADEDLLQRATDLKRVLVTQNDDFLVIAHDWQATGRNFTGLIYCHQLNITIGAAIEDLELLAGCGSPDEFNNRIEFIPLR